MAGTAPTPTPDASPDRRDPTIDNLLERWTCGIMKQRLDGTVSVTTACLQGAQQLRRMQIETAQRLEQVHRQAAGQIVDARSVAELMTTQLMLMQANAEGAIRYASDYASIANRTAVDIWSASLRAMARINSEFWSFAQLGLETAARAQSADALEAQAEHLMNPFAASLLAWPAQEASRELVSLALAWTGGLPPAAPAEDDGRTIH